MADGFDIDEEMFTAEEVEAEEVIAPSVVPGPKPNGGEGTAPEQQGVPAYVTRLNKRHAVVRLDAKTAILDEQPGNPALFMTTSDLHLWYANDKLTFAGESVPVSLLWIQHERRRQYERVVFDPLDKSAKHFNLWQGFAVKPDPSKSCEKFLRHVKHHICAGNEDYYQWVIAWLAHMVQRPEQKPGVGLVLRGDEGVGKGFFANVIGRLCPHHYVVVSQAAHLTGRFNAHHAQCLLMFVDEGFWAGDKHGEGALKHFVTDHELLIEPKHVNAFMVRNLTRLIIASNEHWVVPAGTKARRWFVLDVANTHANDRAYFTAIEAELNDGGLQALMHRLLTFDLSTVDIFTAPKTEALFDQKEESLPPHERWWLQCLQEGAIDGAGVEGWPAELPKGALWESYRQYVGDHNIRARIWPAATLLKWMRKCDLLPGSTEFKPHGKPRVITLPSLADCREAYAMHLAQPISWESEPGKPGQ
jgi:hypothetical protein